MMSRSISLLFIAIAFNLSLAGNSAPDVLGEIGGQTITQHDYGLFVRFKSPEMKEKNLIPPHEQLFVEFATDLVLAASAQAGDASFTERGNLEWKIWEFEAKEAYARLLEERMFVERPLPEAQLREYYNANTKEFARQASFAFHNVFLDATRVSGEDARKALAQKAQAAWEKLERLKDPEGTVPLEAFIRVAAETMEVPEEQIQRRGDFRIGQIKPVFEETALALEIGQISGVLETENGYYILRLESRVDAGPQPFEEVADKIEDRLVFEIQKERFTEMRKPLLQDDRFEIHEEGLANLVRWATDPTQAENVLLAETEGFKLSVLEYIDYLKYAGAAAPPNSNQSHEEIRESHSAALFNHLLYPAIGYDEAASAGYTEDATFQERVRVGRIAILGEEHFTQLLKRRLEAMTPVSEKEIQAYYEEHSDDFMTDPITRYREIAVQPKKATNAYEEEFAYREAEAKALEALELIRSGSPEEDVVRKYSDGEEAEEGGLTPALTPGRRFSSRVWVELKTLEVGEWTKKPHRERGKAILLKLEELVPPEQKPLDSVRGDIALKLVQQRALETAQALRNEILESNGFRYDKGALKAQSPIEVE